MGRWVQRCVATTEAGATCLAETVRGDTLCRAHGGRSWWARFWDALLLYDTYGHGRLK